MATYGTVNAENITSSTGGVISPNITSLRNRIINGAMVIDQRNAGASVTPTISAYTLDRWGAAVTQSSKYSVQQNAGSVTPPVGFTKYLGVTSLSAYSVGASDYFHLYQAIEGFNIADLGWGTANAKTITISFQAYSSLTGTFGGSLFNGSANYSYPFTYSIPVANTWTTIYLTIAGPTAGTWTSDNSAGLYINFGLGVGSTLSGAAGAWASGTYRSATGATSVVGTNGATFYITGVQLEAGAQATSFDYRPYGTELALCQRYYIKYSANDGNGGYASFFGGSTSGNTSFAIYPFFPVPLRAPNPTQTWGGNLRLGYNTGASATLSGISGSNQQISVTGGYGVYNCTSHALGALVFILPGGSGDTTAYWAFQSEL